MAGVCRAESCGAGAGGASACGAGDEERGVGDRDCGGGERDADDAFSASAASPSGCPRSVECLASACRGMGDRQWRCRRTHSAFGARLSVSGARRSGDRDRFCDEGAAAVRNASCVLCQPVWRLEVAGCRRNGERSHDGTGAPLRELRLLKHRGSCTSTSRKLPKKPQPKSQQNTSSSSNSWRSRCRRPLVPLEDEDGPFARGAGGGGNGRRVAPFKCRGASPLTRGPSMTSLARTIIRRKLSTTSRPASFKRR
mmetsp:Transcript_113801/g.321846  ORF Transcript_113801/g.321846 Transcript_113801/m.321846 type:complete len:254 (+) Transcript_113801:1275-2036(+)